MGMPIAHSLIALNSLQKGLSKLLLHEESILSDLDNALPVVAEALQTILRREGYPLPLRAPQGGLPVATARSQFGRG